MEPLPSQLLLMIFACFLPPLVCDETATDDLPLGERVKLFKNLGACRSVCRRWREVVEEIPSLFSREARVIEGDQVSKVGSRALGSEYVKRPYVWGVSNGFLAVFPDVTHASWPCQIPIHIPLDDISYPSPKHLRRLDWKFSGDFKNSVRPFIKLVEQSPVLECITVTETPDAPLSGCWDMGFSIPNSVTTLGIFCHDFNLVVCRLWRWIMVSWGAGLGLKHVITSGSCPPLESNPKIELRPNPSSTTPPAQSAIEDFVRKYHPKYGSNGSTLIYSCTTYAPPERYDLISRKSVGWVNKIALKTSSPGSSSWTEEEKWDAVQGHLDFVLKVFQNLASVDLHGDFLEWREDEVKGKVLEAFENLAQERDITVGYV